MMPLLQDLRTYVDQGMILPLDDLIGENAPHLKDLIAEFPAVTGNNIIDGETYAILCADVDLRWVRNIVEGAKPYDYSEVFILGRDSQCVSHPDLKWIQSTNAIYQLKKKKSEDAYHLANKMLNWEKGVDTVSDLSDRSADGVEVKTSRSNRPIINHFSATS